MGFCRCQSTSGSDTCHSQRALPGHSWHLVPEARLAKGRGERIYLLLATQASRPHRFIQRLDVSKSRSGLPRDGKALVTPSEPRQASPRKAFQRGNRPTRGFSAQAPPPRPTPLCPKPLQPARPRKGHPERQHPALTERSPPGPAARPPARGPRSSPAGQAGLASPPLTASAALRRSAPLPRAAARPPRALPAPPPPARAIPRAPPPRSAPFPPSWLRAPAREAPALAPLPAPRLGASPPAPAGGGSGAGREKAERTPAPPRSRRCSFPISHQHGMILRSQPGCPPGRLRRSPIGFHRPLPAPLAPASRCGAAVGGDGRQSGRSPRERPPPQLSG
ncbi:uncharacterized protein LOC129736475 [Falco cherrug]|uniref:uncharacterized protein LOC129736475 n=1 Tax=Falco cherrug TaxID=345164 RepID=UPI00247B1125|nr:uncharacterized protein LOC129736475 [Falco cherrug]